MFFVAAIRVDSWSITTDIIAHITVLNPLSFFPSALYVFFAE
jgi:hypothetical protein